MKNHRRLLAVLLSVLCLPLLCLPVSANSSWRWISETRPYDVLPLVMAVTLAVEIAGLCWIHQIRPVSRCAVVVLLGNLLSFAAPYILLRLFPHTPYEFWQTLEHTPFYTVGAAYLILTLVVEVPVVYGVLRYGATRQKWLPLTVVGLNVATTVLTALAERIFCHGTW